MFTPDSPIARWTSPLALAFSLAMSVSSIGVCLAAKSDSAVPLAALGSGSAAAALGGEASIPPHTTPPPCGTLPPDRNTLVIDGLGTFTMVLYETVSSFEWEQSALRIALHKHKNLPGPPPVEIEHHKVFWGLLEDGTCLYSTRPDHRGAPYVRGRLRPDDLANLQERAARLISVGRDPHLAYPEPVCTMGAKIIHLKATVDGAPVSTYLMAGDFLSAFECRPHTLFPLNAEQEAYRQQFADLANHLLALRATSFMEIAPVPKSSRIHSVLIRRPET